MTRPWPLRPRAKRTPGNAASATAADAALDRYRNGRPTPHRDSACNAPLTNLYFQADGRAAPCWKYYPTDPPYWSKDRSITDIWTGPEFRTVREALGRDQFIGRCSECEHDIRAGNTPLAEAYDNDRPIGDWPTMLELELSNLCNLECTMCNGLLSSRIRKNREHLEPLDVPYDDQFVEQLVELLPHLHELRVNGGEPLLQPLVHRLGERVAELRPDLRMTIATNGTVLNDRVRTLLDRCTVHLNISIDSLIPERYESIRRHASFAGLMEHLDYFHGYTRDRQRTLCIMVNPMRENWTEMPEFVRWANDRDLPLWFNTILQPSELALHSLDVSSLETIVAELGAATFPPPVTAMEERNRRIYQQLVHQITTWRDEATDRPPTAGTIVELSPTRRSAG